MSVTVSRGTTFSSSSMKTAGFSSSDRNHFIQGGFSGTCAPSVNGGVGGFRDRTFTSASSLSVDAPATEFLSNNEKHTMQNLNDRLAAYLEKVCFLETTNQKLELQIREFCQKRCLTSSKDLTGYFATIAELRKQISANYISHAQLALNFDNAKLAAEDFRIKYEMELNLRMMVEADVARMRKVLDQLNMSRSDLQSQVEGLKEEMVILKRNHEEDLQLVRSQHCGAVNVEVDCASSVDLLKEIQEMREQYEALIESNRREAELWFKGKVDDLNCHMTTSTKEIKVSKTELTDQKRTFQNLEIELQGLYSQKSCMHRSVEDVSERYSLQLSKLQAHIHSLETELQQLNVSIQQQATKYMLLLDIKMRLEMEIAEYRRLLDGDAVSTTTEKKEEVVEVVEERNPHVQRRVKVIVEEMVDGEVVSRSEEEDIQEVSKPEVKVSYKTQSAEVST